MPSHTSMQDPTIPISQGAEHFRCVELEMPAHTRGHRVDMSICLLPCSTTVATDVSCLPATECCATVPCLHDAAAWYSDAWLHGKARMEWLGLWGLFINLLASPRISLMQGVAIQSSMLEATPES